MSPHVLPRLRGDLQLAHFDAAQGCTVYDPLRHRFYKLDPLATILIKVWSRCRTTADVASACAGEFAVSMTEATVDQFSQWLAHNELTDPIEDGAWRSRARAAAPRHGWLMWLVHNYLFIKVPLFDPSAWLVRNVSGFGWFYSRAFLACVGLCGCLGLYLVSREWDLFAAEISGLLTLQSGLLFLLALAIVKSLHELGHAVTAARFGCRVPSMGICFMVLTPMLFTDVSDAWRLPSRRQRALVDAAGVLVELSIACFALLAWALLPVGPAKTLAAVLATTSIAMSLLLNLNPFMRFDGYYLLSDLVAMPNLQPRSFALAQWKLREWLFAFDDPAPEQQGRAVAAAMTAYAWMTWLYRLIVVTGIAVLVYVMTFKLLGILLFIIEIAYFIALPIWREFRVWWQRRALIVCRGRSAITFGLVLAGLVAIFMPWSTRVAMPGVVEASELTQLYPRRAAYVIDRGFGATRDVAKGDLIVELTSPELDHELHVARLKLRQVQQRLARRPADLEDRSQSHVLEQTAAALESRIAGLVAEQAGLRIVAPHAGGIVELEPNLHSGRWLQRSDLIAIVRGHAPPVTKAYLAESAIGRLEVGAKAVFVPEALTQPKLAARVADVAIAGVASIELLDVASIHGGELSTRWQQRPGAERKLVPLEGQYLVTAALDDSAAAQELRTVRGVLIAQGRPESFAARTWRHLLKVGLRESGF